MAGKSTWADSPVKKHDNDGDDDDDDVVVVQGQSSRKVSSQNLSQNLSF